MSAYGFFALLMGAVITVMNGINSALAPKVGYLVAILVIHCAGLVAVSIFRMIRRKEGRPGPRPAPYLYLGGCLGVVTVFGTAAAFNALGASLAVALALLGQILFSLAVDATGFLGRKKYPLSARRLPTLLAVAAGIACMALTAKSPAGFPVIALLLGMAAGASNGFSSVLNSELGLRIGLSRATLANYLTGLSTVLVLIAFLRPSFAGFPRAAAEAGPLLLAGGGTLGVLVVATIASIYPRLPAFSASLLLFAGQAAAGLAIDFAEAGALDLPKAAGTGFVVLGLALDAFRTRREA